MADAWEKARLEAEELKRAKFANKRGGGGGGAGGPPFGDVPASGPSPKLGDAAAAPPPPGGGAGAVQEAVLQVPPRVPTPLVAEKVRQLAEKEIGK